MWGRFSKYNCLPEHLNFHALRHAFASNCLINGIPQKYTAELMGHSGTTMIDTVYQHTFPSAMQAYANTLIHNADNLLKSDG
jgi:integrase